MSLTRRPDLVIFDCDGVLIDSEILYCRIDAEEFSRAGYPIDPVAFARKFVGITFDKTLEIAAKEMGRPFPDEVAERVNARVAEVIPKELKAVKGISALLDRIGIPFCVASNTATERLRWNLEIAGLLKHFDPHVYSAKMVARGKPAPDLFWHAAKQFDVAPEHCLVIEDSTVGVGAAIAAGMPVLGFVGGQHCWPELGDQLRAAGVFDVASTCEDIHTILAKAGIPAA
ncbi:MAG: HAD family hydrolase [Alphaproteobacteria bacterium]|nr:HAD family hydrolase [Alphaproteobacteria bacterium]